MTGLREHFAETAQRAKYYDVAGVVIRRARRRRRIGQAGAAMAAVLVAWVSVAVAVGGPPRTFGVADVVDATGPAVAGRLDWLPPTFTVPADPPPLPKERGVGRGALVYCPTEACRPVLLTSDGASYAVPGDVRGLSPDGRWLAYAEAGELVLRSLTDTQAQRVVDSDVVGWAPSGATAVLTERRADGREPTSVVVLDPEGLAVTVPVPDPSWWAPRGLSEDGKVLLAPRREFPATVETSPTGLPTMSTTAPANPAPTPEPVEPAASLTGPPRDLGFGIGFVNTGDGSARSVAFLGSDVPLAASDVWTPSRVMTLAARPDGDGLVFQLMRTIPVDGAPAYVRGDLIEVSAETGAPLRHYRLPPVTTLDGAASRLVGVVPEGILLAWNKDGRQLTASKLEVLDPDTGTRRTVLDLPAGAEFTLTRGGTTESF
jgi:hypothetical protein